MNYRKSINDIKPYTPGLSEEKIKSEYQLNKVIKLASNENPYGASKKIEELFTKISNIEKYPDNYCTKLRNELSKKLNVSKEKFIFGNGSVEIIQMITRILINKDDEVITCMPSFQSYFIETNIEYGKVISVPLLKGCKYNLNGILEKITEKTKIIYIPNPNNPTGTIVTHLELNQFLEKVPEDILVVIDEAYAEYVNDKNYPNSIELIDKYKNICILRTFSKAYGLAGLRIGYGISDKKIINELEKVRLPFNVSAIAQNAAIIALNDSEFLKGCIKNNREIIKFVYQKLEEYNINYIETEANFIMIDTGRDSNLISEKLQRNGFIVRPNFPNMQTFIRVTIGTKDEMKEFIECLNRILKES